MRALLFPPAFLQAALFLAACGSEPNLGDELEGDIDSRPGDFAGCLQSGMPQGIDVSTFQGTVNWAQVASAGMTFGIAKATEGVTIQDDQFAANWSGMQANHLARGAYHFFHPGDDGTTQADDFLAMVGPLDGGSDLLPMLDWETMDSATISESLSSANAFIEEIQAKTGLTTVLYTNSNFWENSLHSPSGFQSLPLWVADWQAQCPSVLSPWTTWTLWQTSDTGTVAGVSGSVDLDVFNGTLAELLALGHDAGISDAGMRDGGEADGGKLDGGERDGGELDGGTDDAGARDGGEVRDGGEPPDGGEPFDAGTTEDAGAPPDAGATPPVADGGKLAEVDPAGCGCSHGSGDGELWVAALLFTALGRRHRRR